MNAETIKPGDVLQINDKCGNAMFHYCFLIVSEVKTWGVQGFVQALGENGEVGGRAYIRLKWECLEYVGKAVFVPASLDGE